MQKQNWLITGVSTGLGRAFAEAALAAGHTVVGTVRSEEDLRTFEELRPGNAHGRLLDVTDAFYHASQESREKLQEASAHVNTSG